MGGTARYPEGADEAAGEGGREVPHFFMSFEPGHDPPSTSTSIREDRSGLFHRGFLRSLGWPALASCLLLAACARLPDVDHLKAPGNAPETPRVVDGQGTLSDKDASSVLARRLGHAKVDSKLMAGLEEAATGRPLIAGNKVTLLFDGPTTIKAMMAAVSVAKDSINLETYLFDQDPLGMKFAELLIAKQKAGVQVNIIYDCVGTLGTPQAFFDRMQEAGIRLLPFQPA